VTKITIRKHGPVRIEGEVLGDFVIYDADGNAYDLAGRTAISLCRCGQSENKPFCDSKHKECGFNSEVKARVLDPLPAPVAAPIVPPAMPAPAPTSPGEPKA
jgi:CDGSH-type Zn-finger protein